MIEGSESGFRRPKTYGSGFTTLVTIMQILSFLLEEYVEARFEKRNPLSLCVQLPHIRKTGNLIKRISEFWKRKKYCSPSPQGI